MDIRFPSNQDPRIVAWSSHRLIPVQDRTAQHITSIQASESGFQVGEPELVCENWIMDRENRLLDKQLLNTADEKQNKNLSTRTEGVHIPGIPNRFVPFTFGQAVISRCFVL